MTEAKVICDSRNEHGQRITTFILTFPRYLLAEVNTHRMLSRNSASSRAIRFEKMVQSVMDNPFIPMRWQLDHAGMQGTEYFTDPAAIEYLKDTWLEARNEVIEKAKDLNRNGLTKQICNRLLEPFIYHTALVTGTEWENFFALRAHEAAEIHFQDLAEKMLVAINESEPKQLKAGEWHIPFGDKVNLELLAQTLMGMSQCPGWDDTYITECEYDSDPNSFYQTYLAPALLKICTTRSARISYVDTSLSKREQIESNYEADLKLHDRLSSSGHWSAFEHCARAMNEEEFDSNVSGIYNSPVYSMGHQVEFGYIESNAQGWCGNFKGFIQYRKMFFTENRSDSRLIKK